MLRPGRKRRTRERLEITYCANGWYSRDGGPEAPYGDAICQCIIERELWHRYDELHPDPVLSRIRARDGRWETMSWWCDAELPDDIRELTTSDGTAVAS